MQFPSARAAADLDELLADPRLDAVAVATDVPSHEATSYELGEPDFALRAFRDDILPRLGDQKSGDILIGLASSGPHSNGYSLIRKLIKTAKATPATKIEGGSLYDALLAPTRIYVKSLLALAKAVPVRSFAHITGGGLSENIPRVIPSGLEVQLSAKTWTQPPVFDWLQKAGSIPNVEMYRTFNCGIGMTVCVAAEHGDKALKLLSELGEQPSVIGEVRRGDGGVVIHK